MDEEKAVEMPQKTDGQPEAETEQEQPLKEEPGALVIPAEEKRLRPGQEPVAFTKATEDRLARIEMLLISQAEYNRKMLKAARIRAVILAAMAAVFAIGFLAFYNVVKTITVDVPQLIVSTNKLVETAETDIDQVVKNINKIDFEEVNTAMREISKAVQGIGTIDFNNINKSIEALSTGVTAFQKFAEALAAPATAVGNLFG